QAGERRPGHDGCDGDAARQLLRYPHGRPCGRGLHGHVGRGGRRRRRPAPPRAELRSRDRRRDAAAMRRGASLGLCAALAAAPVAAAQTAAPAWTHGAVCYEVFVRSFYDSDGDGIGDLSGLISKLDYINDGNPASKRDLGASCIWLMPIAQSPSYHGYDVSDYYRVEPAYGTNDDFKHLVAEAHRRGIKVLVDMVLNHSSSEHPYFQAALHDTTSPYRTWYRFAPSPLGKGPHGGDDWHRSPARDEYYYGVFWSGMPDLN